MNRSTQVGLMPYLNSALFYLYMPQEGVALHPMVPTAMAKAAYDGLLDAGPIPLVDCFNLEEKFEPLGDFCIATTRQARSILLFSTVPVEELEGGSNVAVTDETSTSARLLRVLLRHRYGLREPRYVGLDEPHDALLLIGDGALKQRHGVSGYGYRYDLAEVWSDWTGLPTVFALWIVRRELAQEAKAALTEAIARGLEQGWDRMAEITAQHRDLGMSQEEVAEYLGGFSFTVGPAEREAIERFRTLLATLEDNADATRQASHSPFD